MEREPLHRMGHTRRSLVFSLLLASCLPVLGWTQQSESRLSLYARGTGRTTGHIATIFASNPTDLVIRMRIGPCFIPSSGQSQAYVVPGEYLLEVPPMGVVQQPLRGYCANVDRPPVHAGEGLSPVGSWVSWQEGWPLPETGAALQHPFAPLADPQAQAILTWPGTSRAFPYTLDINRHPQAATRLLLHYLSAVTRAVDGLQEQQSANLRMTEREALIQQVFWTFTAALEGHRYGEEQFRRLYEEQWREVRNEARAAPPESVLAEAGDIWSHIALVGAEAKVLPVETPPATPAPTPVTPVPAPDMRALIGQTLDDCDPGAAGTGGRLSPVLEFLQPRRDEPAWSGYWDRALAKWTTWLRLAHGAVDPLAPDALETLLGLRSVLDHDGRRFLAEKELDQWSATMRRDLDALVRTRFSALSEDDPAYIENWRRLRAWQDSDWYADCCAQSQPLRDLPESSAGKLQPNRTMRPVPLTGPGWKTPVLPVVIPGGHFPWWIPAVGIPVAGAGTWLLLRDRDKAQSMPDPPVAVDDEVSVPCQGQVTVDLLANDRGAGIMLETASAPAGVAITLIGSREVLISATSTGLFTGTYAILDSLGRRAQALIRITVTDQDAPTVICPPDLAVPEGSPADPAQTGTPQAQDLCAPQGQLQVTYTDLQDGGPCASILRTWTVTDPSGNSASCVQTIQRPDQTSPTMACPADAILMAGEEPDPVLTGVPSPTDNCTPASSLVPAFSDESQGSGCDRVISRTWTVTDQAGNSMTCLQTIRFEDRTPPQLICPEPTSAECAQYQDTGLTGVASATDDCSADVSVAFTDDPAVFGGCEGEVSRRWTATDQAGNVTTCLQAILVRDELPPAFTDCPASVTVAFGEENNLDLTGRAQATDACNPNPPATIAYADDLSAWGDCGGVILRQWRATDPCGNSATECVQQITAIQELPPTIVCPENVEVECGQQTDIAVTGSAEAKDGCGDPLSPAWTDESGPFDGCQGQLTRTWTATDPNGLTASCTQQVRYVDSTAPQFTACPPPVTVECGLHLDVDVTGRPEAEDACVEEVTISFTDTPELVQGCATPVIRTFVTADLCGNTTSCVQEIFVLDQTPPEIVCPAVITVPCGQETNLDLTGQALAFDGCNPVVEIGHVDDNAGFSACTGFILRTFFAADACGNVSTCQHIVMVENTPCDFIPVFSVTPDLCARCVGGIQTTIFQPGNYSFQWDNGGNGPDPSGLCSGDHIVTITEQDAGCTDIYTINVPFQDEWSLVVLDVVHPKDFSSSDGEITLEVISPGALLPYRIFVNGVVLGTAIANPFQIVGLSVGEYTIQIQDNNGQGCFSNEVFALLFVLGKPVLPLVGLPALYLPSPVHLPTLRMGPEHPDLPAGSWTPEARDIRGGLLWVPLAARWQIRLEALTFAARRNDPAATGSPGSLRLAGNRFVGGLRYGLPLTGRLTLFQEAGLGLQQLRLLHMAGMGKRTNGVADLAGGMQWRLSDRVVLEARGGWAALFGPGASGLHIQASAGLLFTLPATPRPKISSGPVRFPVGAAVLPWGP